MTIEHSLIFIQDAIDAFMLDAEARRFTASTIEHYQGRLGVFIRFCKAQNLTHLHEITPTHIRRFMVSLQEKRLAAATQHAHYRALRAWFNFCIREELLDKSPMAKLRAPKLDKQILPALSVEQAQTLLRTCKDDREKAVLLFLLDTGVRASEFCRLDAGHIDIKVGVVMVHQGKGRKDRQVYLGAKARKQLLKYFMRRGKPADNQPVWTSAKTGKRLTRSGLSQMLRKIATRAGVKVTAHMCRRTFAIWSLRAGMNIYVLQRLMGHEDISILRRYLELVESDMQQGHAKFGAVDNML